MTENREYEELHWVSENNWPFDGMDRKDGLKTADGIVPDNCTWVYSADVEPGYSLLRRIE